MIEGNIAFIVLNMSLRSKCWPSVAWRRVVWYASKEFSASVYRTTFTAFRHERVNAEWCQVYVIIVYFTVL